MLYIWIDDIRSAPADYKWIKSVNEFKSWFIDTFGLDLTQNDTMQGDICHYALCLDIDHDAGDYATDGGDYIKILEWLEEMITTVISQQSKFDIQVHFHSMNPVGVENMRRIVHKMGWQET